MQTQHIPMTIEEYLNRPLRIGWKEEYWDGMAHIRPSSRVAILSMPVCARLVASPFLLRDVVPDDAPALTATYYKAFGDTCEYCDFSDLSMYKAAHASIRTFFDGHRGEPLPASRVAVAPSTPDRIAGAALLVRNNMGPTLDLLFISPEHHRQGLATVLVGTVMNTLLADGEQTLYSGCHLANEPSIAWHARFGFTELPDLTNTQFRLSIAYSERERHQHDENLADEERERLERDVQKWQAEVERLEAICEREGLEAVTPLMRQR